MRLKCTCAKYEDGRSDAECGNVAIASGPDDYDNTIVYLYCKRHVKMFVERKWKTPDYFTLLPGKKMPTFDMPGRYTHRWGKVNLVTLSGRDGMYDLLRCEKCGEEIKRYGLATPSAAGCKVPD